MSFQSACAWPESPTVTRTGTAAAMIVRLIRLLSFVNMMDSFFVAWFSELFAVPIRGKLLLLDRCYARGAKALQTKTTDFCIV
jgi:hypothetical protein